MSAPTLAPGPSAATFQATYTADRSRVDAAYQRMLATTAVPHTPAQARDAAVELTRALRAATATVTRALQAAAAHEPPPRRRAGRRKAGRAPSPARRSWSAELVRLSRIEVWLRRTTVDDLGAHVPTTVRVAGRAATGPHIAGLGFDSGDTAGPRGPRIGVDLQAAVDGTGGPPGVSAPASSPTNSARLGRVA